MKTLNLFKRFKKLKKEKLPDNQDKSLHMDQMDQASRTVTVDDMLDFDCDGLAEVLQPIVSTAVVTGARSDEIHHPESDPDPFIDLALDFCDSHDNDDSLDQSSDDASFDDNLLSASMKSNDPDYPKTTFHLEVAQLLATDTPSTSNNYPFVPSVDDLLQSGYSSEEDSSDAQMSEHEALDNRLNLSYSCSLINRHSGAFTKFDIEREILRLTHASDILNASHSSEEDLYSLRLAMERLQLSGWYYKSVSRQQVRLLLKDQIVGSFLVRDSTDPGHLFALSVRTPRGTTNVRIEYDNGQFRLDCEECLRMHMPVFSCIVKLVNFYIRIGRDENVNNPCVWLETSGRRDMPVKLTRPLRQELPSLRHLARLTICRQLPLDLPTIHKPSQLSDSIDQLPLPNPLIRYIKQYPYAY